MTKPRCEDIGFQHLWEDCTPQVVLLVQPPQYPPKEQRCANCGKHERLHEQKGVFGWVLHKAGTGKCEQMCFQHVWRGPRDAEFMEMSMESYRVCINCGRGEKKTLTQPGVYEWREVQP